MKIAHHNFLLQEGLLALGATLYPLYKDKNITLHDALIAFDKEFGQPDLVVIEFLGIYPWKISNLDKLLHYPVPIVVFAADSPINIFYYKYLLKFFDYVFVDQQNSVQELKQFDINAQWLPLSVSENYFRDECPKTLGISFVGRKNTKRIKRHNLLQNLAKHFQNSDDFQIFENVHFTEMQSIFASSQITINENLFNGLTWRVFQALASGTLLLTEANMDGLEVYFKDQEHLLYYTPDTLVKLCHEILENPEKFKNIAKRGQELCRKEHTSTVRAKQLMECILKENVDSNSDAVNTYDTYTMQKNSFFHQKDAHATNQSELNDEMIYTCAACTYYFVQMHGGSYSDAIYNLKVLIQSAKSLFVLAKAEYLLAYISANEQNTKMAEELFLRSIANFEKLISEKLTTVKQHSCLKAQSKLTAEIEIYYRWKIKVTCHLSIFYLSQQNYDDALKIKKLALYTLRCINQDPKIQELFSTTKRKFSKLHADETKSLEINILFTIAQIYANIDIIFELGYNKPPNSLPNNALLLGILAWQKSYHTQILDFILPYIIQFGVGGNFLPELTKALELKKVTNAQIEQIHDIAKAHYCFI